jgi:mono/diheme cytochrome c family protein
MKSSSLFSLVLLLLAVGGFTPLSGAPNPAAAKGAPPADLVFLIGKPDARCAEFALVREGYAAFPDKFGEQINFTVGKSNPARDWPFVHPAKDDQFWAKKAAEFPFAIQFDATAETAAAPTTLVIGYMGTQGQLSPVHVAVNGKDLPPQTPRHVGAGDVVFHPARKEGNPAALLFAIPAGLLKTGANTITITLRGKSWILYDYVALRKTAAPLAIQRPPEIDLLATLRKGHAAPMRDVKQIVFAVRSDGLDEHWYANFGYYAAGGSNGQKPQGDKVFYTFSENGGKLCLYDLDTKTVRTLLEDETGAIRDPQVSYDAKKILFSYRRGGTKHYYLYEINMDGTGLKQLTSGDADDIEPTYTSDGKIIFVSSRAKRWVQCWLTPVAILHGCDADGSNIRPLSGNVEHDNTPWPLPNGQILYTRWEYVDRSQVHYHHLWTMNPDGTRQMVYFGNLHPGRLYIDAKPVPGSGKVVAVFSPGHGQTEHAGPVGIIDPHNGPDDSASARTITRGGDYRDPWAFSENAFMASRGGNRIVLFDDVGNEQVVWSLPKEWAARRLRVQEPRPVIVRQPERRIADVTNDTLANGKLILSDVYEGRNMKGVKRGEIKKLLILETLPKPINFTGGMEPLTYTGSFTLERIVGTVPVEPDGSAHFELPALRAFFFVALDKDDRSVKRMQSFLSLMPGETNSCIGCHEERTVAPTRSVLPSALRRPPSPITPVADYRGRDAFGNRLAKSTGIPDVIDFPRDIQPIFDRHCVSCHNPDKRSGGVSLVGHRAPLYSISYYTITARELVADGRNLPKSNYPPRTLGSSASRLLKFTDGTHHKVKLAPREATLLRLWTETGATYPGTYAGLGSGMVGGYARNSLDRQDTQWPEVQAMTQVLQESCVSCHSPRGQIRLPLSASHEIVAPPWENFRGQNDARRRFSRNLLYDLTVPEKSTLLLAPLAKSAGGYESCGKAVLSGKDDPRYKTILAGIERTKRHLDSVKRFDMPGFLPRPEYIRELKKYGIVPPAQPPNTPVNTYDLEQRYWESLWHKPLQPAAANATASVSQKP